MHNLFGPGRHSAISKEAAAPPPQPDQEIASLERIFADSQETALRDCEAAADESKRAEHRKTAVSGTQSLMAKMSVKGAPVTRPAPDAPTASARSGAKVGGVAQDGPGPRDATAPRPQAKAREECVIVIDDDDCIDIGLETSSSGGAQAAPLPNASAQAAFAAHEDAPPAAPATCTAQGAPGTGAAAAPKGPGASRPTARAAPKGPGAGGAAAPAHPQAKMDPQDPPLFEDDDLFEESGPEALRSDGAPDSSGGMAASSQAAPEQAAPPTAPQAARAQAASTQAIPKAAPAQADTAADQAAASAAGGAAATLPQQPAPRCPEAAAIPAQQSASQRRCAAMRAGAVRKVFGLTAADMAQHDPNRSPAGGAAVQRNGTDSALPEQRHESRARRGPDPALANAAGPCGHRRAQAQAQPNGGPFDGPWDAAPNDCGAPDGWESDGKVGDCGAPDRWEADGRVGDHNAQDGWETDGRADDCAPDGWEADGVAECGAAPDETARDACGRRRSGRRRSGPRRSGPRLGRWTAAILLVATAAAAMVWPGGSGIERFSDWRDSQPVPAQRGAPESGIEEIRRMVADALNGAPGETAPPADTAPGVWPDDGAADLRGAIADALNEDRVPDGAGYGPAESAHEGGVDAPGVETAAAASSTKPASAAGTAEPVDPLGVQLAQIERRLGDAERGAVSAGGLIGTLGAAIADAAARMEAIERDRASMDSRLADLELHAAEAGRAGGRTVELGARLDETDTVVLDLAARVAALEAEADAGAIAMTDAPVGADAPGWVDDWGPDPFAADGPRTQWDDSVDDNPVYRRIPAAARLVRGEGGRLIPVFVETPADDASDSAAAAP